MFPSLPLQPVSAAPNPMIMWALYLAYMFAMIGLGYVGGWKTKTMSDFVLSGRGVGTILAALCYASTWTSGASATPGMAAWLGWGSHWSSFGVVGGTTVALFLTGPPLIRFTRKLKSLTVPDFVGDRYESDGLRALVAILVPCIYVAVMVAQYKALGVLMNATLGVTYTEGVLISAAIMAIYMSWGGSWGDVYTDTVQGILMSIVMMAMPLLALWWSMTNFGVGSRLGIVGDIDAALRAVNPKLAAWENPQPDGRGTFWIAIFYFIGHVFHVSTQPYMVSRFMVIKDPRMFKSFMAWATLFLTTQKFLGIAAIIYRAFRPELFTTAAKADWVIPWFAMELGGIWSPMVLLMVTAAAMSTMDGLILVVSSNIGNDLYLKSICPRRYHYTTREGAPKELAAKLNKRALWIARIATWIISFIPAIIAATYMPEFVSVMVQIGYGGMGATLFAAVYISMKWRNATKYGAYAAVISGISTHLLVYRFIRTEGMFAGSCGGTVAIIMMLVVSLATQKYKPPKDFLDRLFPPKVQVPAGSEGSAQKGSSSKIIRIVSYAAEKAERLIPFRLEKAK